MKLFDSHAHLDMDPLSSEREAVIERAYKAGVEKMINIGSSLRGSSTSIEIANLYPNIYASVGLHPHDVETVTDFEAVIDKLREMTKNDKVVAIGEIGLDYFNLGEDELKKDQKDLFVAQLELAKELNLPVIIHTREAEEDTLDILKEYNLKGVIHCFTGNQGFVKKLIDLGFYIGFTGFVTFEQEKFDHIREAAKAVPLEKLLIETDAPFLAPEPYRGKPNEPAYVVEVAKSIAQIKGILLDEVARQTFENAEKLFDIA